VDRIDDDCAAPNKRDQSGEEEGDGEINTLAGYVWDNNSSPQLARWEKMQIVLSCPVWSCPFQALRKTLCG
jgi:hypothetical protein